MGCSASGAEAPSAALASSHARQSTFQVLLAEWARGSQAERIAMKARLYRFRQAAVDPLSSIADALLAWVALEEGSYEDAERRALAVQSVVGRGNTADVARAVQGAALRRRGRPEDALKILSPLVSKLIDGYARDLLNEEIVESALAAHRYPRALQLIRVWLRETSDEERAAIEAQIMQKLGKVPTNELLEMLDRTRGMDAALFSEEEQRMRRIVTEHLAIVALDHRDAEVAKRLLVNAGPMLAELGDAVARLAAGGAKARVEARTVGLLISLRSDETRRRGAEVVAGVTYGLGLPGSTARLVSRDDRGDPERIADALGSLSADGASVLIAGVDEGEATAAARFAESNQIPVLLLTPPPPRAGEPPARFAFVVGTDPRAVEDILAGALAARGSAPVAILTDDTNHDRALPQGVTAVRTCSDASAPWKPLGALGIVLDAGCAPLAMVAAAPTRARFAAGFEAGVLALPSGSLVATAGLYPIDILKSPPVITAWMKTHATAPSFWAGLGRDAAVLAWSGVQALPAHATEEPKEVTARRAQAAEVLAKAEVELWTSDARGFGGGRTLPRSLGAREVK